MRILISILILFNSLSSFTQELEVSVNKNPALTNEVIQLQFSINAKGNDFIPPSLVNFHILNGPSQGFSQSYSNINGKTITIKYISDSLATDNEMIVHKFAEEAMYKYIVYTN